MPDQIGTGLVKMTLGARTKKVGDDLKRGWGDLASGNRDATYAVPRPSPRRDLGPTGGRLPRASAADPHSGRTFRVAAPS